MEKFQQIDTMKEMARRYSVGFTPRQALVAFLKDELRIRVSDGSYAERSTKPIQYANIVLDSMTGQLWVWAKAHSLVWLNLSTPFGTERKLSDFGMWLLTVKRHYEDMSDKQHTSILKEAIVQAGLTLEG